MDYYKEREQICRFGNLLLEKGLVARTWGNLSIKVSDDFFLITPSGRSYEELDIDEIPLVNLNDLTYRGDLKPSSEKELHSRIYRQRPEIKAVIHTHQPAASVVASARTNIPVENKKWQEQAGPVIPCVTYAMPTTKRLAKAAEKYVIRYRQNMFLLSNHGALCLGTDLNSAFEHALLLEQIAEDFVLKQYRKMSGNQNGNLEDMLTYYKQIHQS